MLKTGCLLKLLGEHVPDPRLHPVYLCQRANWHHHCEGLRNALFHCQSATDPANQSLLRKDNISCSQLLRPSHRSFIFHQPF